MEVVARASFIRTSPRKLRLVAQGVRKLSLPEAIVFLEALENRASLPLLKVVKQAIANATNNLGLDQESLKIKKIEISQGPIYKRWRVVSRGRTHEIQKKTSHIMVILAGEEKVKKRPLEKVKSKKEEKNGTKS